MRYSISCKKDKDTTPTTTPKTKTELLTGAKWKWTGATASPAVDTCGGTITDVFTLVKDPACDMDDLFMYTANGLTINDEGATKCAPADPQIDTCGTWKFIENETKLVEIATGPPVVFDTFNIVSLTATTLTISYTDSWLTACDTTTLHTISEIWTAQ